MFVVARWRQQAGGKGLGKNSSNQSEGSGIRGPHGEESVFRTKFIERSRKVASA